MEIPPQNLDATTRGKTAMQRYTCSRPIALALADGLIGNDDSFFDFGCGRGSDVKFLRKRKIEAAGWDPFHFPEQPVFQADVVNLGFVLNVIEDPRERAETLHTAFGLARKLLIVSVRVEHGHSNLTEFGDGIITNKGTFQKIYTQTEFTQYVKDILGLSVQVAGIGVVYVFANQDAESEFLAKQAFSRRLAYRTEIIEEFGRNNFAKKFIKLATKLGRIPLPDEFKEYGKLLERFGSAHRIERLTLAKIDPGAFEGSKTQRREDLLTYIAMARLQGLKVPPIRSLPAAIQADFKALWPDYRSAINDAEKFLFSIGKADAVREAIGAVKFGKLVFDDLYVHRSLEEDLPPLIRLIVFAARQIVGDVGHNLIKISIDGRKVSFLYYEDFDNLAHPPLRFGMKIYLPKASYQLRDFSSSENPPILHRKDALVSQSYPYYGLFHDLTIAEEQAGLLSRSDIGFKKQWESLVSAEGFFLKGHALERSNSASPGSGQILSCDQSDEETSRAIPDSVP